MLNALKTLPEDAAELRQVSKLLGRRSEGLDPEG